MPNHVHVVVRPVPGWTLSRVLQGWKGYTGHEAAHRIDNGDEELSMASRIAKRRQQSRASTWAVLKFASWRVPMAIDGRWCTLSYLQ